MTPLLRIQPISIAVVDEYRETRLRALRDSPTAFGSTLAKELQFSSERWVDRAAEFDGVRAAGYLASIQGPEKCGLVGIFRETNEPTLGMLVSMWVAPEVRKLGVGRALVGAALDWARNGGVTTVKLMVTSNNEAALRLYLALGFVLTGKQEPYPNDLSLFEYEMSLQL